VLKAASKKFNRPENTPPPKLFNRNGVLLFESDFGLVTSGDTLYLALRGEDFNYCAILDDYEVGRTLGIGGFGEVKLGRHRENKSEVAIKFADVGQELSSANLIQAIYREAEALKALQHKHIVKLHHAFVDGKRFVMIMEAAMGGQLLDYLKKYKTFTEIAARHILL
jgi:serine/threonine protein kinase